MTEEKHVESDVNDTQGEAPTVNTSEPAAAVGGVLVGSDSVAARVARALGRVTPTDAVVAEAALPGEKRVESSVDDAQAEAPIAQASEAAAAPAPPLGPSSDAVVAEAALPGETRVESSVDDARTEAPIAQASEAAAAPAPPMRPSTPEIRLERADVQKPVPLVTETPRRQSRAGNPRRLSRRLVIAAVGLAIVAAAIGGFFAFGRSSPTPPISVPSVVGVTAARAEARLRDAGFTPVTQNGSSSQYAKGSVYKTTPSAGSDLQSGDQVTIWISTGAPTSIVPDVIGKGLARAKVEFADVELKVAAVRGIPSEKYPKGVVTRQSPGRGKSIPRGSEVTLWVSTGKPERVVPSVLNESEQQAITDLRNAGFKVRVTTATPTSNYALSGFVASQSPTSGVKRKDGTLVTISVWYYNPPAPPPPPPPPPASTTTF